MSLLLPNAQQQFCDGNGIPLAGGLVYTYAVGTTTPATTYSDYLLTLPNTNPIVLDGNGRAQIWGVGAFQQLVTDQFGNEIWNAVTTDGSIDPSTLFAPISGSPYYAPASGSPNYAPASGSAFYAAIGGSATQTFLVEAGTNANNAMSVSQYQIGLPNFAYDTGTANAKVAILTPAISGSYTSGQEIRIANAAANTGPATLNVNGVGAAPVILANNVQLTGGEMPADNISVLVWNLTYNSWQLLNPSSSGTGFAVGQTWQNVTSSRAIGGTYTNSGTKPIMVSVTVSFTNAGVGPEVSALTAVCNGAAVGVQGSAVYGTTQNNISWVVPIGASYSVSASISGGGTVSGLYSWSELK
jgi:hypothetical protein